MDMDMGTLGELGMEWTGKGNAPIPTPTPEGDTTG